MSSGDAEAGESPTKPSMDNRRVSIRQYSTQETPCHFATLDSIEYRWARVHDVSSSGVALLVPHPFDVGQQVIIELPSKKPGDIHLLPIRVIHTHLQADGLWFVGSAFTRPLTELELQELL